MSCIQKGVNMNEAEIRKYAALMKELELTGFELTHGDKTLRLERNVGENVSYISVSGMQHAACEDVQVKAEENTGASIKTKAESPYISVRSPMVGVFYAAPAENASPYAAVGDCVKKGQTLCIVEAMKLMNEITAETDGIISQICVSDGQMVEYGTELFKIQK